MKLQRQQVISSGSAGVSSESNPNEMIKDINNFQEPMQRVFGVGKLFKRLKFYKTD